MTNADLPYAHARGHFEDADDGENMGNLFANLFFLFIFVMLLGVLNLFGSAEIIPYEPDMYNNSAGKRYWYSLFGLCLQGRILWLYNIKKIKQ